MMSGQTRVLYFINGFTRGGAEAGLLHLVRQGTLFANVDLCIAAIIGGEMLKDFHDSGIRPIVFTDRARMRVIDAVIGVFRLTRLIGRFRPDVLILSLPQANIVGRLAGTMMRVPTIVAFEHNATLARPMYERLYRWTSNSVDVVFADCRETLRVALSKRYGLKSSRRGEIVPLISLPAAPALPAHGALRELVAVGRLTAPKNHKAAIEAVALLRERIPDLRLTIFGEGPLQAELEALTGELGVERNVVFAGFRPRWWQLGQFDALILPSQYEGLSITAVEAMWAGVPVVAPLIGGLRDYADESTMVVLPDIEAKSVAYALIEVCEGQTRQRLAQAAQARVMMQYSLAAVDARYRAVNAALFDRSRATGERRIG